jgi:hypothetical protein
MVVTATHPEDVEVVAYAGYRGEQEPRALIVGGERIEVAEIVDRWLEPRARCFRVRTADGAVHRLRYDLDELCWRSGGDRPV